MSTTMNTCPYDNDIKNRLISEGKPEKAKPNQSIEFLEVVLWAFVDQVEP